MTKIQENTVNDKIDLRLLRYRFKSRRKNPEYSVEKLVLMKREDVSLRSCLIHNNATPLDEQDIYISKIPKWLTILEKPESVDLGTGEINYADYETDDFKASRNRKIKTVEKFCDFYEPLYRSRKVSLLFHTFTRMNYSKRDMRRMVDKAKEAYIALNRPIRGYLWALEISETNHIHYHLVVAIDRVQWKEIPKGLKFESLWGQRTGVEFIKRTIKGYLSKYLYKSDGKILGKRSYAISRKIE
jgi:hypothetical protein